MKKAILIFILLYVQLSSWGQIKRTPEQDSLIAQTNRKTKWDHENMLAQLGITNLRTGASGTATAPNAANYEESKAVIFPNLPALLKTKDGLKVSSKKCGRGFVGLNYLKNLIVKFMEEFLQIPQKSNGWL